MADAIKRDETVLSESEKISLRYTMEKLEAFYPEHKTYAMDALCSQQRENCVKFQKKLGYDSVDDFLAAYGFEMIKGPAVYEIRKDCGITPGNEPELIKTRMENALKSLNEYYPDHIIEGAIQREHKNLAQTLAGFWQWLGYKDMAEMLSAYGFTYNAKAGRKASVDPTAIIDELKKRYPEGVAMTALELKDANPDLKIKSVMNKSKELFGMAFSKYLLDQGILLPVERAPQKTYEEKLEYQRNYAKEKQKEKATHDLAEYERYYLNAYKGWTMLPSSAEILFRDHDTVKQMQRIRNALKTSELDADEYFKSLGILANNKTDNELRLRIQKLDFKKIADVIGVAFPNTEDETYLFSETQKKYITAIKYLSTRQDSINLTQLSAYLSASTSSVSKSIGFLEAEDLVKKDDDKGIILSDKGKILYDLISDKYPELIIDDGVAESKTEVALKTEKEEPQINYEDTILKGKTFSAAGFSESDEEYIAKSVELNGGRYLYNFTSGLNYLIYKPGDAEPLKYKKAKLLEKKGEEICFITLETFNNMIFG